MANFHVFAGAGEGLVQPRIRRVGFSDLREALTKGVTDFLAMPSHLAFLGLIYPILGICLAALTFSSNDLPLLYPLMSGFVLIGPFAAIGLYEISRRRELSLETSWRDAFAVLHSPAIPSIIAVGVLLMLLFVSWLATAHALYEWIIGPVAPNSYSSFLGAVLATSQGWSLIALGNLIGLLFAAVVLSISVVSFPMLIDRDVGAAVAIQTSISAVATNPITMALWGLIVAGALALGSVTLLIGLAIVMPVLGHATWHLYRRVIEL